MGFEAKIEKLEKIVNQLENKNVSLDEGIALYTQGLEITKECVAELNSGKERIRALQNEMQAIFNGENTENE